MIVGYARVSTTDQNLAVQEAALTAAGCERLFTEKKSGTTIEGRTSLMEAIDFARQGDTLVVTRIDRLARSIGDLQTIMARLKKKGIALSCTEQPVDTNTAAGKAFIDVLGVFAEFEANIRKERQLEGIADAKAKGKYKGRKPSLDRAEIIRRHAAGEGPKAIAEALGISRMSVHRVIKEAAVAPGAQLAA